MPASILLLTATSRFMGAVAVSAEEGANQGGTIASTKAFAGLRPVGEQAEPEWRTCEFVQLEDLLDFDCVLLLLHGRNDAARAMHFMKQAAKLPEYKHFVGKLGSVFFVPGAEAIDLEDRRKELAYEMMKLGFLTAELPYRILADNEAYHAGGYGTAGPSLIQLVAARLHARHIAALTTRIALNQSLRSELLG
ncbi:hypothetical protein EHS39_31600 [Ensifer sp. MPMI2T]|nr:hypothetical protein EHS39_31600 [Ensifer sp. MPMI2T]